MKISDDALRRPFAAILLCFFTWGISTAPVGTSNYSPTVLKSKLVSVAEKPREEVKPKLKTLPGGKSTLESHYTLAALYGAPDEPALGVLGEQPVEEAIIRAQQLAAEYQPFTKEKVLPTFEMIATVASAWPTDNNDYSQEVPLDKLASWVLAAKKAGVYVILDLQSGRSDFLSQAVALESLLKYPNVGLALDPEWRLKPHEVPLDQIGTVDSSEINLVSAWLADLTARNKLPQKIFLLHQFRLDMITHREWLDTSRKELAFVIQMDGNGDQMVKQDTWSVLTQDPPPRSSFGWKNFYDEDSPTLSPEETMKKIPTPSYVSYQ